MPMRPIFLAAFALLAATTPMAASPAAAAAEAGQAPDRSASELAGQQWALEVGLSTKSLATITCVPQVADLQAMWARRRAAMPDAGASR